MPYLAGFCPTHGQKSDEKAQSTLRFKAPASQTPEVHPPTPDRREPFNMAKTDMQAGLVVTYGSRTQARIA